MRSLLVTTSVEGRRVEQAFRPAVRVHCKDRL